MIPLVGVPQSIAKQLSSDREVFCRAEGFEHISRYVSGLILSENKTLQGIYAQQVYPQTEGASRRAMHSAVKVNRAVALSAKPILNYGQNIQRVFVLYK